jgi:DNA invertase Pin-like site-specific DNA recombinase
MLVDKLNSNGVNLKFHKENLIFATGSTDANSAFQLHLFGIIAQYERAIIRERQREGIAIAQRKGKYLNRNCNTIGENKRNNAIKLIGNSNLNAQEIADAVGVSRTTIINIKRELRNAKQESSGETL